MIRENALEIIKSAFCHLIVEEDVQVGSISVLLHFPTMGIALVEATDEKLAILDDPNIEDMDSMLIKKELGAETVYLDLTINIGYVLNDILLAAQFMPAEGFLTDRDVQD